jgi:hypothetical protein
MQKFEAVGLASWLALLSSPLAAQSAPAQAQTDGWQTAPAEPAENTAPSAAPAPSSAAPPPAAPMVIPPPRPAAPAAPPTNLGSGEPDHTEEPDPGELLPAAENAAREPWLAVIGGRALYITSPGYDPFDDNDELTQFSIGFGRSVYAAGRFALAGLVLYDVGGAQSTARDQPTELTVHRVSLGFEARFHALPELYGYGRIAPAVLNVNAKLEEAASGATLEAESWVFGLDATAGLAYRFARTRGARSVGFWAIAEGGYGLTTTAGLSLEANEDSGSAPQRLAALSLGEGELSLSGATFRVLAGLTF